MSVLSLRCLIKSVKPDNGSNRENFFRENSVDLGSANNCSITLPKPWTYLRSNFAMPILVGLIFIFLERYQFTLINMANKDRMLLSTIVGVEFVVQFRHYFHLRTSTIADI